MDLVTFFFYLRKCQQVAVQYISTQLDAVNVLRPEREKDFQQIIKQIRVKLQRINAAMYQPCMLQ